MCIQHGKDLLNIKNRRKIKDKEEEACHCRDGMYALRYERGNITNSIDETVKVAERFYADLYASNPKPRSSFERTRLLGQDPRITKDEVKKALKGMKRGKAAGDDGITVDLLLKKLAT